MKSRLLFSITLVIALCGRGVSAEGPSETEAPAPAGRVAFGAVEDTEAEGDVDKGPFSQMALAIYPGVGFPRMKEVNSHVNWVNDTSNGSVDDIDTYGTGNAAIEFALAENWWAGAAYQHVDTDATGHVFFMGMPTNFNLQILIDGGEVFARRAWPDRLAGWDVEGLLGLGHYNSVYREEGATYWVSGHDEALGLRAGVGVRRELGAGKEIFAQAGYLWLKFNNYRRGGEVVRFASPGNPRVKADFSGLWVVIGLRGEI